VRLVKRPLAMLSKNIHLAPVPIRPSPKNNPLCQFFLLNIFGGGRKAGPKPRENFCVNRAASPLEGLPVEPAGGAAWPREFQRSGWVGVGLKIVFEDPLSGGRAKSPEGGTTNEIPSSSATLRTDASPSRTPGGAKTGFVSALKRLIEQCGVLLRTAGIAARQHQLPGFVHDLETAAA
jgi:hypothetical protein